MKKSKLISMSTELDSYSTKVTFTDKDGKIYTAFISESRDVEQMIKDGYLK